MLASEVPGRWPRIGLDAVVGLEVRSGHVASACKPGARQRDISARMAGLIRMDPDMFADRLAGSIRP